MKEERQGVKVYRLLGVVLLLLGLTGCWDRKEINDIAIITAAGVDLTEDKKVELSVQLYVNHAGRQQEEADQTVVQSATGITLADAVESLQDTLSAQVFWGHTEVFIFGRDIARTGIEGHVDYFFRQPGPRGLAYLFVSRGKAKDILKQKPPLERSSSKSLEEIAKAQKGEGVTLKELAQMMENPAKVSIIPLVATLPEQDGGPVPYIYGMGVLKKGKWAGQMDEREAQGVLWLRNRIKFFMITIPIEKHKGYVSLKMVRGRAVLSPQVKNSKWSMQVKLHAEYDVRQNTTNLNMTIPADVSIVESYAAAYTRSVIKASLNKAQNVLHADVFDFSGVFHRKYPQEWKKAVADWERTFSEIEVDIQSTAEVLRPGVSNPHQ
ncbi:Ger(x)C family spore germination protein [Brevibacillus borstelensis]|uniref:Ger(x)C family spore germination protein n=1 Tax=Brevibacillus borstelensis TaxID=45462 RepID=UPI00203B4C44|nr:Ger(x)C family spore germination protein [Brevibacillus borstelensis]MCM3591087.1 Ger(x)C family spore germination protein [Brevibacillus borstelensis]